MWTEWYFMKRIEFGLSLALVWVAGCASGPVKPAPQPTMQHKSATALQPDTNAVARITLPAGAALPAAPFEGDGREAMFDGTPLAGWRETPCAGHGEVHCQDGLIVLSVGVPFTGINWTNDFPK